MEIVSKMRSGAQFFVFLRAGLGQSYMEILSTTISGAQFCAFFRAGLGQSSMEIVPKTTSGVYVFMFFRASLGQTYIEIVSKTCLGTSTEHQGVGPSMRFVCIAMNVLHNWGTSSNPLCARAGTRPSRCGSQCGSRV